MFLKLAAYVYWRLISGLTCFLKNLLSGFLNNAKFVGMDLPRVLLLAAKIERRSRDRVMIFSWSSPDRGFAAQFSLPTTRKKTSGTQGSMDQIRGKNCNKRSVMEVNKILLIRDRPSIFVSFQWNQTTMRWSRFSKSYHFLKVLANCIDSMLFHCFYDSQNFVSKYFQNALIEFVQTLP